jgi:hypothetical protein
MELNLMARCLTYNKNKNCNSATPGTQRGFGRWDCNEASRDKRGRQRRKDRSMGQHQPFSAAEDTVWLASLVDTFARAEQIHGEPCNPAVLEAAMARLQRPAARRPNLSRRGEFLELSF